VSEGSWVSPMGRGLADSPGLCDERHVAGWKVVVDAVHAKGGKIFAQLWHCGRSSSPHLLGGQIPVAPSPIPAYGRIMTPEGFRKFPAPRMLEMDEIPKIAEEFAHAAQCAKDAGFDGVEIHAGGGFLIDQFLQTGSNVRRDKYGGFSANRCRFLFETVEVVAKVWGEDRVGVKLSPSNRDFGMIDADPMILFTTAAKGLNEIGIAYINMVEPLEGDLKEGDVLKDNAQRFRQHFDGKMIAGGGFDLAKAEMILENEGADLVSFGRLFIANPDLPERFRTKRPFNTPDPETFYGEGEQGYTDYPALEPHPYLRLVEEE
ncbi:MAG TPA: alkene reductase, partial [Burkholderiales bacterium]|nr:alkene reductase [Burkholderiales bacterium]